MREKTRPFVSRSCLCVVVALCFMIVSGTAYADDTLIAPGADWRYNDTGTDLGVAWRLPDYDDAAWAEGPAELGYGDADVVTVIDYGPDANNKYPCYYFRHTINIVDPAAYGTLLVRVVRDDGCVVHINDAEIVRSNMPAGEIVYSTWASTAVGGDDETAWQEFSVPADMLVVGDNVVAVEIHQANATSSDVSFNLELIGVVPPPPIPEVTLVAPRDGDTVNTTDVVFTCSATDELGLIEAELYIGAEPSTVSHASWLSL